MRFLYRCRLLLLIVLACITGCASNTYTYTTGRAEIDNPLSPDMQQQVYVGTPHKVLDASDWYWIGSLLGKLVLLNPKVDSHEISEETLSYLMEYVDKNDLENVQILVNTYKPGLQFKRLFRNRTVGAGWRFTVGFYSAVMYAAFPGRFFGGDHYNPYTNTISIYSDDYAIALHEAAHAKDLGRRKRKGLHAFLYGLPGAALYYEAVASSDVLSYMKAESMDRERKHAYRTLHPAYGTYVGGTLIGAATSWGFAAGAIPGHITGNTAAAFVQDESEKEDAEQKVEDTSAAER
ncbi:hypothetical protein [Teredinibacter sp. KSP-S5-2]|uniref:hypothetical protein n=1 Tax=Teredinibacter sp. KSP-S5-2 TaxID=3034506 RepID=UPI002935138E|nr:hypothetical protein [Teredinibacter sp. KSP-S5-2]WNO10913.1 hypothetical protein P5V12_06960 [Teredinibacter sp. KSP-S5-2]